MGKKVKPKAPGKGAKAKVAKVAPGHNSKLSSPEMKAVFTELDSLHKEKAEEASSYASRIGTAYEKASNQFGVSTKAIKEGYAEHKFEQAKIARRKAMTPEQQLDVDRVVLAASWKSSPLAQAAADRSERAAIAQESEPEKPKDA